MGKVCGIGLGACEPIGNRLARWSATTAQLKKLPHGGGRHQGGDVGRGACGGGGWGGWAVQVADRAVSYGVALG
jgi:hypothetical protein